MKKLFLPILMLALACEAPQPSAQEVVDAAIEQAGTMNLDQAEATFTFREMDYTYSESNGRFEYVRIQMDSLERRVRDILTNDGLQRFTNDSLTSITEEKRAAYTSSVNSVIYFAFLPYRLNDVAVIKNYVGNATIKDKSYHKIKVTFQQEGGGEDYEDVFYYWFDVDDYSMDYIAYSYNEDDDIGLRFRVAYNPRKVAGVTIQDYENWKPTVKGSVPLETIDQAYENGSLTLLSKIELENVKISFN